MDLKKIFGYEGKTVVITGSASGMSKAATELLLELGAEVYAIDINPIDLPVKKAYQADLSKKQEIDKVIDNLPDKIDALFLCHGIAGFKGKELLVQKVNFYSQKYMTEKLLDRITDHGSVTFIASVGGFGWQQVYPKAVELINLKTWDEAMKWYEEHPKEIGREYHQEEASPAYIPQKSGESGSNALHVPYPDKEHHGQTTDNAQHHVGYGVESIAKDGSRHEPVPVHIITAHKFQCI